MKSKFEWEDKDEVRILSPEEVKALNLPPLPVPTEEPKEEK